LKTLLKQNKLLFLLTVFISILSSALVVFIAIVIQKLIDTATQKDIHAFMQMVFLSIGFLVLTGTIGYLYRLSTRTLIRNLTIQLRKKVFQGIFNRNMEDFSNTADYISAMSNDIKLAEENYFEPILLTLQNIFIFIISLTVLLYLSPIVTLILLLCVGLMFVIPSLFSKAMQQRQSAVSSQLSAFTVKLKDLLSGHEIIKTYGMQQHTEEDFKAQNMKTAKTKFLADRLFAVNESVSELLAFLTQFIVIFVAGYLIISDNLSVGMLVALVQLSGGFVGPVLVIMQNVSKLQGVKPIITRLEAFMTYEDHSFKGKATPQFKKYVTAKNVSFSYQEQQVLQDINLTLEKGKKYAIVGPSGCGKSTLIKLLSGYYAGYSGTISIDGLSQREVDISQLQAMIATIHQQVYMFDSDVLQNICLYEKFSEEAIKKVIQLSGIYRFEAQLPNGLSSLVGENGANLSGGQRQRIAVARALIRNKPILILDEGTSAIDAQTAYEIESKLLTLDDLTLITITHNLNPDVLSLYDEIIYMDQGSIVAQGSFAELREHSPSFCRFQSITA
jgi:ABC-type multidrug transport system fused ATPase/permease subunit